MVTLSFILKLSEASKICLKVGVSPKIGGGYFGITSMVVWFGTGVRWPTARLQHPPAPQSSSQRLSSSPSGGPVTASRQPAQPAAAAGPGSARGLHAPAALTPPVNCFGGALQHPLSGAAFPVRNGTRHPCTPSCL